MKVNFDASRPIYEQIITEIKRMIVRGELNPGDKLPSQRDMARLLEVNPNTIQRTYREMEMLELVETKRGTGTFLKEDEEMIKDLKNEMARQATERFIREMNSLGFKKEKILQWIEKVSEEVLV